MSGPTIVIGPTPNPMGVSGGTQSASTGTMVFSNSNNVTFGMSGSSRITASASFAAETPFGLSAGTQSVSTGTLVFSNSNNVTFGMSGSSRVTASASFAAETPFGVSAGTQSVSTGTMIFSDSNGISFGMSGSSRITASYTVPTETPFGVSAGTQSVSTGTLVFSNSNNVTFGMSGSSRVTASASFPAETPFGVSAGTQSVSTGTMVFSNSNGISFGMSGSSQITASYTVPTVTSPVVSNAIQSISSATNSGTGITQFAAHDHVHAGVGPLGISSAGNTAGDTAMQYGRVVLVGGNNITLSGASSNNAAQTITISGPNTAAETPFGVSAGTQSVSTGTLIFSNSNNVTFGMSGSSRVTASASFPSETPFGVSAGTQSISTGTLIFSDSNGVTFGMSGSSRVTVSFSSVVFSNSNNVSFGLNAGTLTASASGAETPFGVSAGTQSVSTGTLVFSNSNGVTFGMSGSSRVTASVASSLTNVNLSAGTTSNNLSAFVLSNSNNISFGLNGSTITASGANTASTFKAGLSDFGNTSGTTGQVQNNIWFAGINNITMSQSVNGQSATLTISGPTGGGMGVSTDGNTAGSTGTVGAQVVFVGSNNITLSQSTAAGGSATITIIPPPDQTVSFYEQFVGGQGYGQMGQSKVWVAPFVLQNAAIFSAGNNYAMISLSTSSNSSHAGALSFHMGVYSRNASTLSLVASGSQSFQHSVTSNSSSSLYGGVRQFSVPLGLTLTAGRYFMAVLSVTSTTNANWFTASNMVVSGVNSQFSGPYGVAENDTYQVILGLGSMTANTASLPSTIALSRINGAGAAIYRSVPYWNLVNVTA